MYLVPAEHYHRSRLQKNAATAACETTPQRKD